MSSIARPPPHARRNRRPKGRRFLVDAFRFCPACTKLCGTSPSGNEGFIDVVRGVVPVVSLRLSESRSHDDASFVENFAGDVLDRFVLFEVMLGPKRSDPIEIESHKGEAKQDGCLHPPEDPEESPAQVDEGSLERRVHRLDNLAPSDRDTPGGREPPWVPWRLLTLETRMESCHSERSPGKPTTRRYTPAEKEQAVRLVRQLRKELGTDAGDGRSGWPGSSATGSSRCGPGSSRPTSTTGSSPG